ncbi:MAG: hypothetical protein EP330_26540 [Deltaproteobacteria bacterium]|nr:MAG: hypothetical protein EP330_26540 [Deltaproteobacteria bacterium]
MRGLGRWVTGRTEKVIDGWHADQQRLRAAYGVGEDTPIRGYDEALRAHMEAMPGARLAETSGSTKRPKVIAYTPARLKSVQKSFAGVTLRTVHALGSQRPVVFTLASLAEDGSFTALMTQVEPSLLDVLVTPHAILPLPALRPLIAEYGVHALRMWAMVLSNPGWLYSTNPSTQVAFFHALQSDWMRHTALVRAFRADPARYGPEVHRLAMRIASSGWEQRADTVIAAEQALPPEAWLSLEVSCAWDGGNNGPYVRQLEAWLPSATFVPMFSMSTETLETLTVYDGQQARFLPIAPGVLYEFLPAEAEIDDPAMLVGADRLEAGREYVLVASDGYGLRRYMTEDVFLCRGHYRGLPDLHFLRRRGLTWSFTGEKLTGAQIEAAWEAVGEAHPALSRVQATVIPTEPPGERLPGYRVVLANTGAKPEDCPDDATVAACWDEALGAINEEYLHKRESDRLRAPVAEWVDYDALAQALRGERGEAEGRGWDSQFKLLPMICRRYEELAWTTG